MINMKTSIYAFGAGCLLYLAAAGTTPAQELEDTPAIDPEAETILRKLSERSSCITSAVFRVVDAIDEVQPDGRKLQFSHIRKFTVVRPNKLKVEITGQLTSRVVWMDGKSVTVLDRNHNVYARLPAVGALDQAVDMLQKDYNMSLPAVDLLTGNLYQAMTCDCSSVDYLGLGYVGAEPCHHLAFRGSNIDWQLWITSGDSPAMRKMVITYKHWPGQPQYTMELLEVESQGRINDTAFNAEIPEDAEKIEFHPIVRDQVEASGEE